MAKLMLEAELAPKDGDESLSPDELLKISIFDGLKAANLERYPGAVVLRRFKKGEIVCRQGEPGWTAFYILKSEDLLAVRDSQAQDPASTAATEALRARVAQLQSADAVGQQMDGDANLRAAATVSLATASQASSGASGEGLMARLVKRVFGVGATNGRPKPQFIPIDGPVDLSYENPVATLNEGEVFGEMSCVNRYPRSATVRATADCYMVEMLRNIFEVLQKNKAFKAQMDEIYRRRVLDTHLRSLPIFKDLDDDVLAELRERVDLVEKSPGEVIFAEGDPSDSMYVVRIGMVKVTQSGPGGDRVLAYRARGEYIGEIGLMRDEPRMATCVALDHPIAEGGKKRRTGRVELIRIARADFDALLGKSPELRRKVEAVVAERLKSDEQVGPASVAFSDQADSLGLMQGQKLMLIDLDRCTRCDECVRACAATHTDGRTRLLREGPRFGNYLVPSSCRQCLDPVCMIGCPVGSIHKGKTGEIVIEDWCIGCEICAKQCPYDSINMFAAPPSASSEDGSAVDVSSQAVVCDQCSSLSGGEPSCVYSCPHDAAARVDARVFFAGRTDAGMGS